MGKGGVWGMPRENDHWLMLGQHWKGLAGDTPCTTTLAPAGSLWEGPSGVTDISRSLMQADWCGWQMATGGRFQHSQGKVNENVELCSRK